MDEVQLGYVCQERFRGRGGGGGVGEKIKK